MSLETSLFQLFGEIKDGKVSDQSLRELYPKDSNSWTSVLQEYSEKFEKLKHEVMPSIDKVKVDPLSALSDGDEFSEEWTAFYKNVELISFIKGDLDRLYMSGIEDEYFQSKSMRSMLLAMLFIYSYTHSYISYRQGMHEIAGICVYVVTMEQKWIAECLKDTTTTHTSSLPSELHTLLASPAHTEALAFMLFERIMVELEVLYDPLPLSGAEALPYICIFCTKVQEHYLRILDPALAQHIEDVYIQAQLYGLRWARLLLAREFDVTHAQLLSVWDYMFASVYDTTAYINNYALTHPTPLHASPSKAQAMDEDDEDAYINMYSVLAHVRMQKHGWEANK
eukprot:gene23238-28224_t